MLVLSMVIFLMVGCAEDVSWQGCSGGSSNPAPGLAPIDFEKVSVFFFFESIYVFTSDIDWAPEWAIQDMINLFNELELPLTIFTTHYSEVIEREYSDLREHVGIHPNFTKGDYFGQIDYCQELWPEARSLRTHSFYDVSCITEELWRRGFKYDSTLCTSLQPYCTPINHHSGLVRFPVFWEDDVHDAQFAKILEPLSIPGLKVFNFHPTNLYSRPENITFLKELAKYIQSNNYKVMYLDDLYSLLIEISK